MPVACCKLGRSSAGWGDAGNESSAPAMSSNLAWLYLPIVNTGELCRANSWATFTLAPPDTSADMKQCRNE
ncbi:MAG TPA: hypothetical protein VL096_03455 [Pirellulaceae bacterium]|nr:hypothetical protein [Pirellulaceae bacterium]